MKQASRRTVTAFLLSLSMLGLAGCSNSGMPQPVTAESTAHPALSPERVGQISAKVYETLEKADVDLDVDLMKTRLTGPAAISREFSYKKKSLIGEGNVLSPIGTETLQSAVSQHDVYPRILAQIMEAPASTNLQRLNILVQENPRSNWKLWASLQMQPGATIPAIATGETGATVIAADDGNGLVVSPIGALDAYIHLNQTGDDANGLTFAEDFVRTSIAKGLNSNRETIESVGEANAEFARGGQEPFSLRTADGGALVFAELIYTTKLKVTKDGGSVSVPADHDITIAATGQVNDPLKVTNTVDASLSWPIAFVIPAEGSEDATIRVVAGANGGTPFSVVTG